VAQRALPAIPRTRWITAACALALPGCGAIRLPFVNAPPAAATAPAPTPAAPAAPVIVAPPTGSGLAESEWPNTTPNPDLQGLTDGIVSRTRTALFTPATRRSLCGDSADPTALRARADAVVEILRPLRGLLGRAIGTLQSDDPTLRDLFTVLEELVSQRSPSVTDVSSGLAWVVGDAYARVVCAPENSVPHAAAAVVAMANEPLHVRRFLEKLAVAPVEAPRERTRYWTARTDLTEFAGQLLAELSATGDGVASAGTATLAQAAVEGAPFTCDPGALHRFDVGGPGNGNRVAELGELVGMRLHCRNNARTRMLSQSIVVGDQIPPGLVYVGRETVVPEVDAGGEFDLPVGPVYLSSALGATPIALGLRVVDSATGATGNLRITFQPMAVSVDEVGLTPFEEDLPGSSTEDSAAGAGPGDHLETRVALGTQQGLLPTVDGVEPALAADRAIFNFGALATPATLGDPSRANRFVSADDFDVSVGSPEAFESLDLRSPVALARLPNRRVARVRLGLTIESPTMLATIARGLAAESIFTAATALAQSQGISASESWAALSRAGALVAPVSAQVASWAEADRTRVGAAEHPDDAAVLAAVGALRAARLLDAATERSLRARFVAVNPRALWAIDSMVRLGLLDEAGANALRSAAQERVSVAIDDPSRTRLVRWAELAARLAEQATELLRGIDPSTADPAQALASEALMRNALLAALGRPLRDAAPPAANAPAEGREDSDDDRHHRRSEHRSERHPERSRAQPDLRPVFAGIAAAAAAPIPPLPTWRFERFVSFPVESRP
jgi:hypothetical protein